MKTFTINGKEKPIAFYDLETTGLDTEHDRIASIAIVRTDGKRYYKLINPTVPMPAECTAVNGLTDEMLKDQPTFAELAMDIYNMLDDCAVAGHNTQRFDNAMLMAEFARVGIRWPNKGIVFLDTCQIEKVVNAHTLHDCHIRYCGYEFDNAHNALADVEATMRVFDAQVEKHNLPTDLLELAKKTNTADYVDITGKLCIINDKVCYNFGKNRGIPVINDTGYARWMLNNDFPADTKRIISNVLAGLPWNS